jgi:PAS domain S-box-containing protein
MQDVGILAGPYVQVALMSMDVLALIGEAVICTDDDGRVLVFNRAAEQTFGYSRDEVIGQNVEMLLPQRFRPEHARQVRGFAAGRGDTDRLMGITREVWGRRKNGTEFPAEATVSRHSINGRTILTVVHRDISERKDLEERRDAIAAELDHRMSNMLSVVRSLVRLSARETTDVAVFEESLLGRLGALDRTQRALRAGGQQSTSLSELILAELEQYRTSKESNIVISGPPVALGSGPAQALALVFHELATNAAKYGALITAGGLVTVTSSFVGEGNDCFLDIEWRETGKSPTKESGRQGFGMSLIKQLIARTFRADVAISYLPEGLVCKMRLPRASLETAG